MIIKGHFIFLLIIFSCCTGKTVIPLGILNQHQMTEILWDMLKADALSSEFANKNLSLHIKSTNVDLYKSIFSSHSVTINTFDKSYSFYEQHPELMKTVLDTMNAQRDRIKVKSLHKVIPPSNKSKSIYE